MVFTGPEIVVCLWWSGSGHGLHVDLGQAEVVVDLDGVDGPEVSDPVSERQQMRLVDGHIILTVGAKDLQLQCKNHKP